MKAVSVSASSSPKLNAKDTTGLTSLLKMVTSVISPSSESYHLVLSSAASAMINMFTALPSYFSRSTTAKVSSILSRRTVLSPLLSISITLYPAHAALPSSFSWTEAFHCSLYLSSAWEIWRTSGLSRESSLCLRPVQVCSSLEARLSTVSASPSTLTVKAS